MDNKHSYSYVNSIDLTKLIKIVFKNDFVTAKNLTVTKFKNYDKQILYKTPAGKSDFDNKSNIFTLES